MKVKYNKELAKAVLKGEVRGEFYHKPDDTLVYPKLITYQGKDLVCFAISCPNSNRVGEFTSFTTISPQTEEAMSIRLFDFEVGDIVAVDLEDGPLVGILSGIKGVTIQTNCWSGLEENEILRIGEHPFCKVSDGRVPTDFEITKFLKIVDGHGYYLEEDNQLCKKEKCFKPFEKVLIYGSKGWIPKFFGFKDGETYVTIDRVSVSAGLILPYKGNEHLILNKK